VRAIKIVNTVGEVASDFAARSGTLTATVWEKATKPESPVSPHPLRNGLLTLVVGLGLCARTALGLPAFGARVSGTLDRRGKLKAMEAALETSLSVEEANRMLFELAAKGHLQVIVEHGRLYYAFWERD
jgi:hypothetical protein